MFTFVPLTVALTGYGPAGGSASAQVWAMSLVGVGDAGGALFTTSTVPMTADGDSWRVAGIDTTQGPIPLVEGDASPPGALRAALVTVCPPSRSRWGWPSEVGHEARLARRGGADPVRVVVGIAAIGAVLGMAWAG